MRTSWRQVRGEDYDWVKPHSFRKTVGTLVERELGLSAASAQLGHSGSAVTEKHYIERAAMASNVSGGLDKLAPCRTRSIRVDDLTLKPSRKRALGTKKGRTEAVETAPDLPYASRLRESNS
ncbi:hypothetical protein CH259_03035 [Rhodococcus sp. 05-2254-4]|nr:hypothetical protein CH259_03035 [Rhodococcus sp. 05-2254-4]OZE51805.1 hypothetical protein CH261_00125 [Rhodococcus sp. 05-2254-3]OZE55939.1 hypothetical protein CH283_00120 [Rhodococcus sp. 05-2254-2]